MRRTIDTFPEEEEMYFENLKKHQAFYQTDIQNRKNPNTLNTNETEIGPIGLLAEELAKHGGILDEQLIFTLKMRIQAIFLEHRGKTLRDKLKILSKEKG